MEEPSPEQEKPVLLQKAPEDTALLSSPPLSSLLFHPSFLWLHRADRSQVQVVDCVCEHRLFRQKHLLNYLIEMFS